VREEETAHLVEKIKQSGCSISSSVVMNLSEMLAEHFAICLFASLLYASKYKKC